MPQFARMNAHDTDHRHAPYEPRAYQPPRHTHIAMRAHALLAADAWSCGVQAGAP
jgi:hypothetical protein